jgi:glycosyltransferase involved in cell wall biosynthesis
MSELELSVVIPCLNEEQTIKTVVDKAIRVFAEQKIAGEVVVVDNGSTDNSARIAKDAGARVVVQPERGYGAAYLKGFDEARGKYIVMADADDTYDLLIIPKFLDELKKGNEFVIGSRFKGKILPGAMPWLHRYIGNPVLSFILNRFFKLNISDSHCGMRAFTKDAFLRMRLRTTGMELASEMVINASKAKLKISEVPIVYHPRIGESKLRSFSDGWRHLRFMLMYSPTHLFLIPGLTLMFLGLISLAALSFGPLRIFGLTFDIHYMVVASFLAILGFQVVSLGLFAKQYSLSEQFETGDNTIIWLNRYFNLEKGITLGLILAGAGLVLYANILIKWIASGFGQLAEVRTGIFALTLMIIGIQIIFSSFFLSMLGIRRKR